MTNFNLTKIERDDMIAAMKSADGVEKNFDLQPPADWDDLDEATTNESIEIEIEDAGSLLLGHIQGADDGIDYTGYEPYEPNPYDGTYSEM